MKFLKAFLLLVVFSSQQITAQTVNLKDPESCTSIMVGKKASADGSVITSHTCDSWYRTWSTIEPAKDYPNDTIMSIYDGLMHTEFDKDQSNVKEKGTIPQATHTYQFFNTSYPCMNEKQLGMGETTITGRRELRNPNGMFMIEELERVALQRCTTAREAIQLMGELIKKYGYADSGECLTIADPNEVWHFEVFGEGKDQIGGVWAAQRIPDDEIGVSANIPRIGTLDLNNKDYYMASDNVYDVAKKLGYWDGKNKKEFKFWKAYGGPGRSGKYKAFSVREFFIFRSFAPSREWNYDVEELPFSIKPEKKISVEDVMNMLAQYYEGTEYDVRQNLKITQRKAGSEKVDTVISPVANPWMRPEMIAMLNGVNKEAVTSVRNIAVPQCAYSIVIQLRSWLPDDIGGVAWFSLDNPGQSPRIPVFCGTTDLPALYKVCGNHRYREDAAVWHFRSANKLAAVKWGQSRQPIDEGRHYFIEKGLSEQPFVENRYQEILNKKGTDAARAYLTNYTKDMAGAAIIRWDELTRKYWNDYRFGF